MEQIVSNDYLEIKRVMDIRTNEQLVAWVEKHANPPERDYTSRIKVIDTNSGEIQQFTNGMKRDYHPRFSPDGKKFGFISTRAEKPQVFVMPLDGGEALKVTSSKNGVEGFAWGPNSDEIAFVTKIDPNAKEEEDEEEILTKFQKEQKKAREEEEERKVEDPRVITTLTYRRDTSYDHPDRFSHIFVINIDKKEEHRVSDGYYHHTTPQYIDDNTLIAVSNREKPRDLSTKLSVVKFDTTTTSEGEVITNVKGTHPTNPIVDKGLIFTTTYAEGNFAGQNTKWAKIDETGTYEIINEDLDRSITSVKIFDENTIFVSVNHHGKTDIRKYVIDDKNYELVVDSEASIVDFDIIDENTIYFIGTHPKHVWAVWKWTKINGVELVEDPNEEYFSDKKIIEPEEIWLTNPEGIDYQGWFFDAGGEDESKPPLVLSIHGGPHVMWTPAGTMWHEWQVTLSRGYSVLAINPIGSEGYGEEISQIITAKWGKNDARDLLAAIDHIKERVDEDNLYITGGSYAGFQTANIISRDNRFKAACAQRGVYDLITFGLTTDIPLWATWEWEGTPWDKLEYLWEHSPVGRAKSIETPLLIIHSENDFRVAISQAEELFAALKLQDKEAVFVRYPRDGHELSRSGEPLHVVDRIERMLDWFDNH